MEKQIFPSEEEILMFVEHIFIATTAMRKFEKGVNIISVHPSHKLHLQDW
jgi:hypothetical protein